MAKSINEKIEVAKLEKEQAEARLKELFQQQKAQERKDRNHRFCKRGGFMEKLLPDLALLTDEQFETFFKSTTANNYGRKALAELVPPPSDPIDVAKSIGAEVRTETTPASKTSQTVQSSNSNNQGKTAEAARVAG